MTSLFPYQFFDLGQEANVPAWFSASLLLAGAVSAAAAWRLARSVGAPSVYRLVLTAAFVYLSIDEAAYIHESVGGLLVGKLVGRTTGLFTSGWVILGFTGVGIFAAWFVPFLYRLPRATAARFIAAGAMYVGGAVGSEMLAGRHFERFGNATAAHAVLMVCEEGLEMIGAAFFLVSVLRYLEGTYGPLELRAAGPPASR